MHRRCQQCGAELPASPPETDASCPQCGHTPSDKRRGPAFLDEDMFDLSDPEPSALAPALEADPLQHRWSDEDFAPGPPTAAEEDPDSHNAEVSPEGDPRQSRRRAWYVDIWLYPFHRHSLAMGLVLVGLPLLISLIATLSYAMLIALTFLLPFAVGIMGLAMIALVVIDLYLIWYVCTCVRDSAEGNMRAPDTLGRSPDHLELTGQTLLLLFGGLLYWLPTMLCFSYVSSSWICGAVFLLTTATFPLALLRAIMDESLSGFNPLPLPALIWRTGGVYAVLVLTTGVFLVLPAWGLYLWTAPIRRAWWWTFLLSPMILPVLYYPLLVLAHLWGRYYDRYAERLT